MPIYNVSLHKVDFDKHNEITIWANSNIGIGCHVTNSYSAEKFLRDFSWVVHQEFFGDETYYFKTIDHATEFKLRWLG